MTGAQRWPARALLWRGSAFQNTIQMAFQVANWIFHCSAAATRQLSDIALACSATIPFIYYWTPSCVGPLPPPSSAPPTTSPNCHPSYARSFFHSYFLFGRQLIEYRILWAILPKFPERKVFTFIFYEHETIIKWQLFLEWNAAVAINVK